MIADSIGLGFANLLATCHEVGLGLQVAGITLRGPCTPVSWTVPRRQQLYDTSNFACHLEVVLPTLCFCRGLACASVYSDSRGPGRGLSQQPQA